MGIGTDPPRIWQALQLVQNFYGLLLLPVYPSLFRHPLFLVILFHGCGYISHTLSFRDTSIFRYPLSARCAGVILRRLRPPWAYTMQATRATLIASRCMTDYSSIMHDCGHLSARIEQNMNYAQLSFAKNAELSMLCWF